MCCIWPETYAASTQRGLQPRPAKDTKPKSGVIRSEPVMQSIRRRKRLRGIISTMTLCRF